MIHPGFIVLSNFLMYLTHKGTQLLTQVLLINLLSVARLSWCRTRLINYLGHFLWVGGGREGIERWGIHQEIIPEVVGYDPQQIRDKNFAGEINQNQNKNSNFDCKIGRNQNQNGLRNKTKLKMRFFWQQNMQPWSKLNWYVQCFTPQDGF